MVHYRTFVSSDNSLISLKTKGTAVVIDSDNSFYGGTNTTDLFLSSFIQFGMTPSMHAEYKGKAHMCQLLLRHGADVNCNQHEYGYTALMFAGLSGRSWHLFFQDVCNPSVNPYLIPKYFPDLVHFCKT